MIRMLLLLPLTLIPAAAFAHPGWHLHPHGSDTALTSMGVATVVAAGTWLLLDR